MSRAIEREPMKSLFVPITKVDAVQRLVYGVAAVEEVDKSKEIFDYDTSKPLFEAWSADAQKFSGGKSLGNVRAMHGKVAAGRLDQLTFNDDDKQIEVAAKIVDDNEWQKVEEGVYTGFSIGGKYEKRWKDGDYTRYTAAPSEVSIVDNPCQPSARFTMTKADGSVEERQFTSLIKEEGMPFTNDDVAAKARELAKAAGDESGWAAHVEAARAELEKKHRAEDGGEPQPTTQTSEGANAEGDAKDPKMSATPKQGKKKGTKPGDEEEHGDSKESVDNSNVDNKDNAGVDHTKAAGDELSQVWQAKDGKTFAKKADAVAHNDELAKATAQPVSLTDALAGLSAQVEKVEQGGVAEKFDGLGSVEGTDAVYWMEKKDFSEDKRKEMAASGEAMKDGSYPIASKADLKNAVQAYGRAKDKVAAKKHIVSRAKALGATDELPADWAGSTKDAKKQAVAAFSKALAKGFRTGKVEDLQKGLYTVSCLARLVQELEYIHCETEWEAASEGDNSTVPQELKEDIANLLNTLKNMLAEESAELFSEEEMDVYGEMLEASHAPKGLDALAKLLGDKSPAALAKVGARHSKKDLETVQKMHDHSVELGATCDGAEKSAPAGDLAKVTAERDDLQKQVMAALPVIKDLGERLKKLEDQPMPRPGSDGNLRVVDKADEDRLAAQAVLAEIEKNNPDAMAQAFIRLAQQRPQRMDGTVR